MKKKVRKVGVTYYSHTCCKWSHYIAHILFFIINRMIPIDHSQYIKSQIYQKVFVEIISEVKKKKKWPVVIVK